MAGIPLVNLARQYEQLAPELDRAIHETCVRAHFVLGQAVATFETAFAGLTDGEAQTVLDELHAVLHADSAQVAR